MNEAVNKPSDIRTTIMHFLCASSNSGHISSRKVYALHNYQDQLRVSVMAARGAHNPKGRFDSVTTQPNKIAATTEGLGPLICV